MADAAAAETATTQTAETTETTETETVEERLAKAEADAEKWKTQSRKNEQRAKDNSTAAKELEEFRTASMSEQEKAVAEAKAEGRSAALKESGARLVDAEIRVAGVGRTFDTDALLALDRSSFVTDDGIDADAIRTWVEDHSSAPAEADDQGPLRQIDLGQGTRQDTSVGDDKGIENLLRGAVGLPKAR